MTADSQQKVEIMRLSDIKKEIKKPKYVNSTIDQVLLCDRIIEQMLKGEKFYIPVCSNYMQRVQTDITAGMRKTVTDWMLEVCEDQNCASQVFLLSVQYLDRVLSSLKIIRSELQLLAAACLFISSKLCEIQPLSLEKLIIYTDCSISSSQLLSMEMRILDKLNWELCSLTSLDFLQIFIQRYNCSEPVFSSAATFLSLAATEYQFYSVKPSLMAGAAFLTALQRADDNNTCGIENLHSSLSSLITTEKVKLQFISFID